MLKHHLKTVETESQARADASLSIHIVPTCPAQGRIIMDAIREAAKLGSITVQYATLPVVWIDERKQNAEN